MSASTVTVMTAGPAALIPVGGITAAFERQKRALLARNAARCPYLLVQLQADLAHRRLILVASFAFSPDREWQQVETHIRIADLQAESGADQALGDAFGRLDDGIGAARIARLFAPLTEEQRLASGR